MFTPSSILIGSACSPGCSLLLLCFLPLAAFAAELPALTGRVVDNAGMIDPATEAALVQKLAAFEKKCSDQIVVATIDTLGGEAIEPYANRLFRAWGLGQAGEDNGILLLVAKSDRKMRIEVGYGLEGTLTDLHSKLIIENTMVPAFRAGDFSGGISRAVDDIIMVLEGNAAELEARGQRNPGSDSTPFDPDDYLGILFVIVWCTMFFGGFAMAILPPIFGTQDRTRPLSLAGHGFQRQRIRIVRLDRRRLVVGKLVAAAGRPAAAAAAAAFPAAADRPAAAALRGAGEQMARAMTLEDHARIAEAVQAAEARTSGEIYCVVARSSDSYFFPAAFMVTLAIVAISLAVAYLLRHLWWYDLSPMTLVVAQLVADCLRAAGACSSFPALRIHLVPLRQRYRRAHDNAMKQFLSRNIHLTAARTGVLLFVSLAERYAEVVADAGINAACPQETWDGVVAGLVAHARQDRRSPTASSRRSAWSARCWPSISR